MKFIHKKSDDEIIESIRNSYKKRWLSFSILLFFSITILIGTVHWGYKFEKQIQEMFNCLPQDNDAYPETKISHSAFSSCLSFRVGFFVGKGIMTGLFLIILAISVINRRKDAMLLEYYDKKNSNK